MIFENLQQLILQAKKDNACSYGIRFALSCMDLQDCINRISLDNRYWCIQHGYDQFIDGFDWSIMDGYTISCLLVDQPKYSIYCDFTKLFESDWDYLLLFQPQLEVYRPKN